MVSIFLFIIMGIVQGILEWLPVSSEGQLVFLGDAFGIKDQNLLLSIAFWLHFGTMISVLIYYREEWLKVLDLRNEDYNYLRRFLIITTIGTGLIGVPIKLFVLDSFTGAGLSYALMFLIVAALVVTGVLLKVQQQRERGQRLVSELSDKEMLAIGLAQGVSIIPGVSRSGTTVTALLLIDVSGEESFRGSFFMSVPAVLGAIALDLLDYIRGDTSIIGVDPIGLVVAIIFAAVFGLLTISFLLKFAERTDFSNIVLYLAAFIFIYTVVLIIIGS